MSLELRPILSYSVVPWNRPLNVCHLIHLFFFRGGGGGGGVSTGLVRLYITGLPLRSCQIIGAPSVQGSAQCLFFSFLAAAGFVPTSW